MLSRVFAAAMLSLLLAGALYAADDQQQQDPPPLNKMDNTGMPDNWWSKGSNIVSQSYAGKISYIEPKPKADPELVGKITLVNAKETYTLRATTKEMQEMVKKLDGKMVAITGQLLDGIITIWRMDGGASGVGKPMRKKGGL